MDLQIDHRKHVQAYRDQFVASSYRNNLLASWDRNDFVARWDRNGYFNYSDDPACVRIILTSGEREVVAN